MVKEILSSQPGKVHMSKILVDCGADDHVCPQQFVAGAPLGPVRGGLLYDAQVQEIKHWLVCASHAAWSQLP